MKNPFSTAYLGLSLFFVLLCGLPTQAQGDKELREKANYIIRFAQYVSWPSYAIGENFTVGVIGNARVRQTMQDILDNQKVKGKTVKVAPIASLDDIEQYPIIYISLTTKLFISAVFQRLANRPILVITEKDNYISEGGSDINFSRAVDEWVYEIFPEQITQKGLYVQTKLITSAHKVVTAEPEPEVKIITKTETIRETEIVKDPEAENRIKNLELELADRARGLNRQIKKLGLLNKDDEKKLRTQIDSIGTLYEKVDLVRQKVEAEALASKAEAENQKAQKESALKAREAAAANQRTQLSILIAVILFVTTLAIVFYYFSQRRKRIIEQVNQARNELADKMKEINRQNDLLEEYANTMDQKNQEIEHKNSRLTEQTEALEEQNRKITDSIRYAMTIQQAMLPGEQRFHDSFQDYFIYYRPKDIVSGDFYWISQSEKRKLVAVVDCTGHGVPGAFMSAIGTELLNEVVNDHKVYDPSKILQLIHLGIYERLRQKDTNNRDGMDVCLCQIQTLKSGKSKIVFAGAKRPLYYTHKGELVRINGDSKYIGGIRTKDQAFKNQEIALDAGDMLYLTSDGYVDSPNPKRKKLGSARFNELLAEIHPMTLTDQKDYLHKQLSQHMQDTPLRDDITIMGIRL